MSLVNFVHRNTMPIDPKKGTFYWVENDDEPQIWFASSNSITGLILLNDEFDLTDSDYDMIAEKVAEKSYRPIWKAI